MTGKRPAATFALHAIGVAMAALVLAVASAQLPANAADSLDKLDRGPKVGQAIPHTLAATDHAGKRQDFDSLKSGRGLVILFNRSVDW